MRLTILINGSDPTVNHDYAVLWLDTEQHRWSRESHQGITQISGGFDFLGQNVSKIQWQAADQAIKEKRSGVPDKNPLDHQRKPDGQTTEADWPAGPGDQRLARGGTFTTLFDVLTVEVARHET
jgi:hypothetical protein